jgi:hypothetical protein
MTTGPERQWLKNAFAVAKKKDSVIIEGSLRVTMSDEVGYDGTAVNTIKFKACQDSRSIRLRMGGKKKRQSFKWSLNKVEMHLITESPGKRHWRTYGQTDQGHDPDKSCAFH